MKKGLERFAKRLAYFAALACLTLGCIQSQIPDTITLQPEQELSFVNMPYLSAQKQTGVAQAQASSKQMETVSLFGVLPLKQVRVVQQQAEQVIVCGTPFGIKMFADGAMVVGFSDIHTADGWRNPGKEAGLQMGDVLVSMDGIKTTGNQQVQQAVKQAQGKEIQVVYTRNEQEYTTQLQSVKDKDSQEWRIGVWVRDSSAGIGTMTFVCPQQGIYAGLGHSISDADTGEQIELLSGEIVPVEIMGYKKGVVGSPGELQGNFSGATIGDIRMNRENGVYGFIGTIPDGIRMEVANKQDVKKGKAYILTTISGSEPCVYEVEIEQAKLTSDQPNRDLVVKITDPALLEQTGGVLRGMSGSPIIQDGKLVGAVTHVLVNDPTRGFGIFAENMLATAKSIA